jgi:eukaryotic-like serine/threonine-protein kinase
LRWQGIQRPYWPIGAVGVGLGAGALAGAFGTLPAAGIAALAGALLGGTSGSLLARLRRERAERNRERNRVIALEQNLKQRGHLEPHAADLTDAVLGGKYRMLRPIATGGIGTVYAAEHLGVGYQVAVKVLRGAAAVDAAEVARLRREARIQMALEHPNIIRTFDLDQLPDGTLYVVMELLRGISLQEKLRQNGPLPASQLIPVLLQTCRALAAAHRQGIVHRDLKPGNVYLCDGGTVKVLDFGMSKLGQEDALTQDGYTLGTPEYMSPEQCSGGEVDRRSDLYAFGVLTYEALTGTLPFRASTRRALLDQHQRVMPKSMRRARPDLDIPEELDQVVLSCLAKRPDERPDGAEQLERALAMIPSKRVLGAYEAESQAEPGDSRHTGSDP